MVHLVVYNETDRHRNSCSHTIQRHEKKSLKDFGPLTQFHATVIQLPVLSKLSVKSQKVHSAVWDG